MSNEAITRLVVGDRYKLQLGRPVGQRLERTSHSALLWKDGQLIEPRAGRNLGRLFRTRSPEHTIRVPIQSKTSPLPQTWRKPLVLPAAAGLSCLVLLGATYGLYLRFAAEGIPVAPKNDAGQVRVVATPYGVVPQEPARANDGPLPPQLPIAAPTALVAGANRSLPAPPVDVGAAGTPKVGAGEKDAKRLPAVVLDEDATHRAPQPASAAAATSQAPPSPSVQLVHATDKGKGPVPQAKPLERPVDKPGPQTPTRGAGLVAITPDGRFAVFTNPSTRLPQQFKVGDQLPTGDAVRSIDFKEGKVITTAKEYSLD